MKLAIEIDEDTYKQAKDIVDTFGKVSGYEVINAIANGIPLGKCDRCGKDIDTNTLCVDCNDRLVRDVFAEKVKKEIEQAMGDFYYSEHDLGVREGFRFALEIIDNHLKGEQE